MATILAVGTATIDRVFYVDGYPDENQELRASHFCHRRGGNATNSLVVLSQLQHQCSWSGVWVEKPESQIIIDELRHYNIDLSHTKRLQSGVAPVSAVIVNNTNGSRTIVHYRDMPELMFEDFAAINLTPFDWVHFEGRNVDETEKMLRHVRAQVPACQISLEIEKKRDSIDKIFPLADVLLFSKSYADAVGLSPEQLLHKVHKQVDQADCICSLESKGAIGLTQQGNRVASAAYIPEKVIDTLGAGDTFNAAIVDACLRQLPLEAALNSACRLAGKKCGQQGLHRLVPG
ncbi:MAG: PfkB family carbohydrate kinase [Gammaproteobacteria bacterium]